VGGGEVDWWEGGRVERDHAEARREAEWTEWTEWTKWTEWRSHTKARRKIGREGGRRDWWEDGMVGEDHAGARREIGMGLVGGWDWWDGGKGGILTTGY
jgi:hypothetical protein